MLLQRIVTLPTLNYLLLFREKQVGNLALTSNFFFNLSGGFIVDVFIDSRLIDFSIVNMPFQRGEIKFYLMAHTFNPALRKQVDH